MAQKKEGCHQYQRMSLIASWVQTFPTWNWERLGARWNSQWKSTWLHFKQSNAITAEGVGRDLCVSLLSAPGRIIADGLWQVIHFPSCVYTSLSPKKFPITTKSKVFRLQLWKNYLLIQCDSRFQAFFISMLVWTPNFLKVFTKRKHAFPRSSSTCCTTWSKQGM